MNELINALISFKQGHPQHGWLQYALPTPARPHLFFRRLQEDIPDWSNLALSDTLVNLVKECVADNLTTACLGKVYSMYGSHFITALGLGGSITTSIVSPAASLSQQLSDGLFLQGVILNTLATAIGLPTNVTLTATSLGWEWNFSEVPGGVMYAWAGNSTNSTYLTIVPGWYAQQLEQLGPYFWTPSTFTVREAFV